MNLMHGILSRELPPKRPNVVWTPHDNQSFSELITKSFNINILDFENVYFGYNQPQLIICNNKIVHYDKCRDISIQFHIPVLMIDHDIKNPKIATDSLIEDINNSFTCGIKVAMSERIAESWNTEYDIVLDFGNNKSKEKWEDIINQALRRIFVYHG